MRHNTMAWHSNWRRLISHWSEVRHEVEDSPRGWLTKSTDTTEQLSSSRYTVQPVRGANPLQVALQSDGKVKSSVKRVRVRRQASSRTCHQPTNNPRAQRGSPAASPVSFRAGLRLLYFWHEICGGRNCRKPLCCKDLRAF